MLFAGEPFLLACVILLGMFALLQGTEAMFADLGHFTALCIREELMLEGTGVVMLKYEATLLIIAAAFVVVYELV
ncbi:hypothetical protein RJT34_25505 [Clitoria ternatea]|uniref:Uncharacterized protein n=1 Tax=Clitoria ternatea TaxID=43366 RepID=A0AAN9FSL5_CLITE